MISVAVYSESCHHARDLCKLSVIETAIHLALLIELYKLRKEILVSVFGKHWISGLQVIFIDAKNRNDYDKFIQVHES